MFRRLESAEALTVIRNGINEMKKLGGKPVLIRMAPEDRENLYSYLRQFPNFKDKMTLTTRRFFLYGLRVISDPKVDRNNIIIT